MREFIILQRIKAGDPSGLEALMDLYVPYVSVIVWNILRNAMTPEDGGRGGLRRFSGCLEPGG